MGTGKYQPKIERYTPPINFLVDPANAVVHPKGIVLDATKWSEDSNGDKWTVPGTIVEEQANGTFKPVTGGSVDSTKRNFILNTRVNLKNGNDSCGAVIEGAVYKDALTPTPTTLTTTDMAALPRFTFV